MDQIKVLVVSSVVPNAEGLGGEVVLDRYLNRNPGIQSNVVRWQQFPLRVKLMGKLRQAGFRLLSQSWECLSPVLPSEKIIRDFINKFQPNVVLSVAYGWWHIQARRVAKEFNLPLVSFFHDWWPDFPDIPAIFRSRVERQFRQTCADSAVAICVSDGMRRELGDPPNAVVIYPIPAPTKQEGSTPDLKRPLRVAYFGNLCEYGPPIENALRTLDGSNKARLEVFGAHPRWTSGAEDHFRSRGLYHGFPAANQLIASLRDFQAVLVVMSFDGALRRRMTTSFPSKMIEGMQLGLPSVIWGPEYCSAVRWARRGNRALCVTDANPSALRQALEGLAASSLEQERLAKSACEAAAGDFNPERIQAQFTDVLRQAICAQTASNG